MVENQGPSAVKLVLNSLITILFFPAIVLLASRLYKRRNSPEGVAGWSDLGVVRIMAQDPDIERLLEWKYDLLRAGIA